MRSQEYELLLFASRHHKHLLNNSYVPKTNMCEVPIGGTFNRTLGMDASIRVSHKLTESSVTSLPSSFVEQRTTTTYVSITKLHSRHTGDYTVNIVERSSIAIAPESEPPIKAFLKDPTGLAESEEGKGVGRLAWDDLSWRRSGFGK